MEDVSSSSTSGKLNRSLSSKALDKAFAGLPEHIEDLRKRRLSNTSKTPTKQGFSTDDDMSTDDESTFSPTASTITDESFVDIGERY
jgi:hypothetical protein